MSGTPLRASPTFAALLLGAHAAAAGAAWISLPGPAGISIALLTLVAGGVAIHGHALLHANSSPAVLVLDAAGLRITDRIGRDWTPVDSAPRYVNRWFVIVTVDGTAGRARRVLVVRDMLAAEPFRRLRIWALWGALPGVRRPGGRIDAAVPGAAAN